ncbi:MAG TPA: winged helix-turn-helix domain-containing protein, partial [Negativicutes bacterium]|nr:winged helix-turn-helix domain-containing protein [Negativicutes bacterium]
MDIQPINRDGNNETDALYMQIVERIRQWILKGQLKDGDLLPSERDLAQMFDVSRVPVREALKVLEFLGAVKHVRGKGVYV